MSKIYVEPFSGISGNMFMGALFDLGASFPKVKEELTKLNIGQYELIYEKVDKCGIRATHFDVKLTGEGTATFSDDHHEDRHEEHHHDHDHEHEHEHHHEHDHEHEHEHHHEHRNLADILGIINSSGLSETIKEKASLVFMELGKAEAKVHGKSLDEIHFHEVGAVDTIIDIVGSLLALEDLGIDKVYVGRMQTGRGFVHCAHGLMPIPAPATAELLKTLPNYQGEIDKELVTPTGAALMFALAKPTINRPENFNADAVGYGAGTWDLLIPNVLRVYLDKSENALASETDLVVGECNLDDITGEVCGYTAEKLMTQGALDAWYTPIYMKKCRPAYKLSVLCQKSMQEVLEKIIFTETSTLGMRYYPVERTVLTRHFYTVKLPMGEVQVKAGYHKGYPG
jgi:uncharacterized protein (TIGR00299 family) protein